MRTYIAQIVFLFIIFWLFASAVGAVDVGLNFKTQRMFGHTTFHIEVSEFFPPAGSDVKLESELEFPLDVFLVGANMKIKGNFKTGELWSVDLGGFKSINNPSGYMKDSDWIGLPEHNLREKFSFTESNAELKGFSAYVEGRLGFVTKPNFILEFLGGYEFQDFSFEVLGIRGWQGFGEKIVNFDTLQGINVGDYEVKYHIPYGGLAAYFKMLPQLSFEAKGSFSPQVRANDFDDHILRNKTGEGDCKGRAFRLGADLRWIIFTTSNKSNWSLGLQFDFMSIHTKGTQVQSWYGDDPASEEDDTGDRIAGIKQKINSNQLTIQAKIGYEF